MAKNKTNKKVGQRKCSYHSEECLAAPETMDIEEVEEEMVGSEEELWDIIEVIHGKTDRVCHMEGCNLLAVAVWKSNLVNDPNDVWPMCESCQENYYGGWPDDIERPATFIEEGLASAAGDELENNKAASNVATKDEAEPTNDAIRGETVDDFITSDVVDANKEPTSESEDEANSDENEADEVWDVKKIMSIAAINHECPIKCSHETCDLPAAVAMVSNVKPNENWYSCLDCQEKDFGGWPDISELPVTHMTQEHIDELIAKCSKRKDIEMPLFPESPSKACAKQTAPANTVTPPPQNLTTQKNDLPKGLSNITPSPALVENETSKNVNKVAAKPSKVQLEIHRKWQAAAEAAGGPDARIVLSKPAAKKIIYDFLYDEFRPMNITEIHKGLGALIPSPILKACLDDMALDTDASTQFAESDNDEAPNQSKKEESSEILPYKGSLSFKAGKGSNSSLYYVNYSTAKNGNGLERGEKNELAANLAAAEAEEAALKQKIADMRSTTAKLLSEPTNEEAKARLETAEADLTKIQEKLDAARMLKVNEKHKMQTKRRVENMTTFWRKRRRMCMDFLISMEEVTDGTISAKKCLTGDGQIDVDSDEAVAKVAIEYGKKKRVAPKGLEGKKFSFAKNNASNSKKLSGISPSESFVAVLLDSQGCVQRVHLNDEEQAMSK